ncbi:MSCRAMM family protein [Pseudonocardia sp. HH130630-07]|uniref:MSCRAMM family protein n=1 Tax=Pseudonocardia sp. HH130630-07 TaxID=1690815 RepID=UPI000814EB69|nr:carboxypeptidase-like regulatory domain-containing protein [Pseudonocardia sp. HH130630-07]ANY08109.1 hypothetical protein AFB00_19485 [Pseudonocardia sp. HH130630-07]
MTSGPSITGTVRRRGGAPVPAATVTVTDLDGRQHGRAVTDGGGGYAVVLRTGGTYLVVVRADGAGPDAGLVAVRDDETRHDVVTAGGGVLHGVLTDHGGVPVPGAAITLIDQTGTVVAHAPTGPDGRFHLGTPGTGPHVLTGTAPGHQPVARTVAVEPDGPPGAPLEIRLPARAVLTGTARTAGGLPVPGARMVLTDPDGRTVATTTTGPDGRYELLDLPAGRHSLTASGHPPVVAAVQIDRGATTPVEVHFPDPRERAGSGERSVGA